jgi:hypothetical protein
VAFARAVLIPLHDAVQDPDILFLEIHRFAEGAAGSFLAKPSMAYHSPHGRSCNLITNGAAKTSTLMYVVGHLDTSLIGSAVGNGTIYRRNPN